MQTLPEPRHFKLAVQAACLPSTSQAERGVWKCLAWGGSQTSSAPEVALQSSWAPSPRSLLVIKEPREGGPAPFSGWGQVHLPRNRGGSPWGSNPHPLVDWAGQAEEEATSAPPCRCSPTVQRSGLRNEIFGKVSSSWVTGDMERGHQGRCTPALLPAPVAWGAANKLLLPFLKAYWKEANGLKTATDFALLPTYLVSFI